MSQSGIERARPFGSAWFKIWQVLALILGLYVIEQDVEALLWSMHRLPAAGSVGLDPLHDTEGSPQFAPGYVKANHVEPGSPLANAGLTIGCKAASNRDPLSAPKRDPLSAVVCSRAAA
jgi:hypothetical protein